MKKVLMIATQDFINDTSDGGKKCSFRNWKLLQDVFDKENVTLIIYTDKEEIYENVIKVKSEITYLYILSLSFYHIYLQML